MTQKKFNFMVKLYQEVIIVNNKLSVKHHCIPQFYLNRFGTKQKNGSHQIFVYNKNNNAFFKNSVSNIGYIKNYNTNLYLQKWQEESILYLLFPSYNKQKNYIIKYLKENIVKDYQKL